jgi:hypothetical protein
MRYSEQRAPEGYIYKTVDKEVFGSVTMKCAKKLSGEILDMVVAHILSLKANKGTTEVKDKVGKKVRSVDWVIRRARPWSKDKELVTVNLKKS